MNLGHSDQHFSTQTSSPAASSYPDRTRNPVGYYAQLVFALTVVIFPLVLMSYPIITSLIPAQTSVLKLQGPDLSELYKSAVEVATVTAYLVSTKWTMKMNTTNRSHSQDMNA
ncbi:hypothetical protein HanRHA438_Chr16g0735971 [Helianthus annuus]|uniref:Uncharacterized protein n=1 Tax=Helianthus annuus TaxID=4232 RepID=A0A9K3DMT0_HELAN|nr:hypothetical protein HanXRQr2_Chr16g0723301 [Helianthus annuus]KAJ0819235.1 hypothetical protein HanPSC8_Chr16g0693781 [Helianthus annuus]KAJ0833737.1 hypothetical protein HanRHA438_Chr16g0735971 [Helianthus annuus]